MLKKNLNFLNIKYQPEGNEERYEVLKDIMSNGTFLPKTVEYKDIDDAFKAWVENKLKISYNDTVLPTMVLYSNQRFTEYSQTWKYVDKNQNLLLNFKTITRENNPQYGKIQSGLWNIPGDRFYLMKKQVVLDDNGSESVIALKMKQPMAVDFQYKVSIFTTNFETINEFNRLVNDRFKARQDYIFPNGHPMPMTLESISDKSSYEIEDRQFYSQVFVIKVMGYVITENDYRVEEQPLKIGAKFHNVLSKRNKAQVEVEEYENPCNAPEEEQEHYKKPVDVVITFGKCKGGKTTFDIDFNFVIESAVTDNVKSMEIFVNDKQQDSPYPIQVNDGDSIEVDIVAYSPSKVSLIRFRGYNPDIAFSVEKDNPEIDADLTQFAEEVRPVQKDVND